jgi:methionyl-tRNA formyltransferase
MAGDAQTGVSIMRLTAGLDSGPVCLQEPVPIGAEDTYGTLGPRLAVLGGDLLVRALDERPPFADQDEDGVTYAEKIGPEDRRLDPARPAAELARTVRALTPHIGANLTLNDGTLLGVRAARADHRPGGEPGALLTDRDRAWLATSDGALELLEVQPPGKRPMPVADWLRGRGGR